MAKNKDAEKILHELGGNCKKAALKALMNGADIVAEEAKKLVPVKTGALRDSIYTGASKDDKGKVVAVVAANALNSKSNPYGGFVEYGNKKYKTKGSYFMHKALAAKKKEVVQGIVNAIKEALRKK